ncbi:MAG: hypothetical protein IIC51_04775, partial [Planctomycetes bacterium]|nr:hypothetical protein [Planctomycetota bacterium]
MNGRLASLVLLIFFLSPVHGLRAQPGPTKVAVAEARTMKAPATMILVASVEPKRRSHVGSEIAGLVEVVSVRQGDFMKKGGVLCRLD